MNKIQGNKRLLNFLNREESDRSPWVPLAGVHFGKLCGYSAYQVLTEPDKFLESIVAAAQHYQPDGLPVGFDIQIEAEILGCDLTWSEDTPPSVKTHPLKNLNQIPQKLPEAEEGRLPIMLDVMKKTKARAGREIALFGLITGPLTLAFHLRGNPLFFDIIDHPGQLQNLLRYTTQVAERMAELYIDAGMDIIGVIEPVASQISPGSFQTYLLEHYQGLFQTLHSLDAVSMLHICGDATQIIDLMCQTGTQIISLDEYVDLPEIQPVTDKYGVFLQGNIPVNTHLYQGTPEDVQNYVDHLLASLPNPKNLILSPGCDLPWATPVENVLAVLQTIHDLEKQPHR